MKQFGKSMILASALLLSACNASDEREAKNLVNSFYQTHQSTQLSGALSLKELIAFRRFLSVPLFDMLKDISVIEEARLAQTANVTENDDQEPPLVDGALFTTHPKGASTYRVLGCEVTDNKGACLVELIYGDAKLTSPFKSLDRVMLERDARGWVIDNIEYDGNVGSSDGLRQGNLQKNLQAILSKSRIVQ